MVIVGCILYKMLRQNENASIGCPSCRSGCNKCMTRKKNMSIDKTQMRPIKNID